MVGICNAEFSYKECDDGENGYLVRDGTDWYRELEYCVCDETKYGQIDRYADLDDQQRVWLDLINSFDNPYPAGAARLRYSYTKMSLNCALRSETLTICRCARAVVTHQLLQVICAHIDSASFPGVSEELMELSLPSKLAEFRAKNEAVFVANKRLEPLFDVLNKLQTLLLENIPAQLCGEDGLENTFRNIIVNFDLNSEIYDQKGKYDDHVASCAIKDHLDDIYFSPQTFNLITN